MRNKRGFTLIELLVVIAIIGLLSTLAVVSLNSARKKARDTKRVADIRTLQSALELYATENEQYPSAVGGTTCWTDLRGTLAAYISTLPIPPSSTDKYFYAYTTVNSKNTIYWVGANKLEDPAHAALDSDNDDAAATITDVGCVVDGAGAQTAVGATTDCVDDIYCVKGGS